jgi:hypothetical protein
MNEIEFRVWDGYKMYSPWIEGSMDVSEYLNSMKNLTQYIGLKDKTGKKIFVGDYVNFGCNDYPDIRLLEDLKTAHYWMCECVLTEYCEVVGNNYEHPNLLKKLMEGV